MNSTIEYVLEHLESVAKQINGMSNPDSLLGCIPVSE